ncbi:DUF6656 family protein [Agrobacterium tumefaciens]|uniref:DUF6656 family protein n=1 Tax=Agrobacterium tumefaciens TaxID=358 RepID=UPI00287E1DE1|nr:DUF6656 family protein [Agrobacterium tumefaciens]MDS7596331.1 hypothetical protein [Agrobacterium tumefaciens]
MEKATRIRYFDASKRTVTPVRSKAAHSEFLRTGRITRYEERWLPRERTYYTHEEVAEITGRKLEAAADATHSRLNAFHKSIRFPKMVFHHLLDDRPHLGYCHVTASKTSFDAQRHVLWSFYFANFFAELSGSENFFENIDPRYSRMYFAIAMDVLPDRSVTINKSFHRDGLLFQTHDPKIALKNVLMLGARSDEMRKIIRAI